MLKKMVIGSMVVIFSILTAGCSLNEGTEELYRQENALKIEILLPEKIDTGEAFDVQAVMSHVDGTVPELENIELLIWKNNQKDQVKHFKPENEGEGLYTVNSMVSEEGLYFVKVKANTADYQVMPTKQFIVGSLSKEDIDSLPKQNDEHHHEDHH